MLKERRKEGRKGGKEGGREERREGGRKGGKEGRGKQSKEKLIPPRNQCKLFWALRSTHGGSQNQAQPRHTEMEMHSQVTLGTVARHGRYFPSC